MSGTMGLQRIMEWLRVLKKDDKGSIKLGHGKPPLKYKMIKDTKYLRKTIKVWKNVYVSTFQVQLRCQKSANSVIFMPTCFQSRNNSTHLGYDKGFLTQRVCWTQLQQRLASSTTKVLTSEGLRKAAAELNSALHRALSRKRGAVVEASPVSGGMQFRIKRKMKVQTPAKVLAAARAASKSSYCQKHVLRKEIMAWLAEHSDSGSNRVDWNCITIKEMLDWAPDECSELKPLHGRTVQDLRMRTLLGLGTPSWFTTSVLGVCVFCAEHVSFQLAAFQSWFQLNQSGVVLMRRGCTRCLRKCLHIAANWSHYCCLLMHACCEVSASCGTKLGYTIQCFGEQCKLKSRPLRRQPG
jgi:hypothetical protein